MPPYWRWVFAGVLPEGTKEGSTEDSIIEHVFQPVNYRESLAASAHDRDYPKGIRSGETILEACVEEECKT